MIDMQNITYASISRRLLALVYDTFLLTALLLAASLPAIALNRGEALHNNPVYSIYLLIIIFVYYAWQWRHGGQTLAMMTWKIKVISINGETLSWKQCLLRFSFGFIGLSILSIAFDRDKKALHDRLSGTICIKTV